MRRRLRELARAILPEAGIAGADHVLIGRAGGIERPFAELERPTCKRALRARSARMIARLLILVARGWQLGPSRILPPSCRYQPSCSAYAITALSRYGALRGSWLALRRLLRCHPWGGSGYDPVP